MTLVERLAAYLTLELCFQVAFYVLGQPTIQRRMLTPPRAGERLFIEPTPSSPATEYTIQSVTYRLHLEGEHLAIRQVNCQMELTWKEKRP